MVYERLRHIGLHVLFTPSILALLLMIGCTATENQAGAEKQDGTKDAAAASAKTVKEYTFSGDPDQLLAEGDYTAAISILSQAIKKNPQSADLNHRLGNAYFSMGQAFAANPDLGGNPGSAFSDAANYFSKALAAGQADAGLGLARSLYMNGALTEAQTALETYLAHKPDDGAALALSGQIKKGLAANMPPEQAEAGINEAIDDLSKAISLDPKMGDAYLTLGDCYLQKGDIPAAVATYLKGIETCPENSDLHGRMIYLAGTPECPGKKDMIKLYADLIEKGKSANLSPEAAGRLWWFKGSWHQQKGYTHYANEEYDLASKSYTDYMDSLDQSAAVCPAFQGDVDYTKALAKLSRGWCYLKLEKYDEAEADFFAALPYFPEDENMILAIDSLGFEISKARGKMGALEFFRRLTSHWGERHQWWNDYGFFSLETNMISMDSNEKYQETYNVFQRALELKPDFPRYMNDSAMLLDYYLDPEGKRVEEIEALYRKSWKLGKEAYESPFIDEAEKSIQFSAFTDALVNLSRLCLRQGRIEESQSLLNELLTANPERREGLMMKGVFDQLSKENQEELLKAPGFYKELLVKTAKGHLNAGRLRESALVVQELFSVDAESETTVKLVEELNKAIEAYNASLQETEQATEADAEKEVEQEAPNS